MQRLVPVLGALAAICALGLPLDAVGQDLPAVTATDAAHEVKAAFLFYFASYVEWPTSENGTLSFALLNAPDVERELERFASGRSMHGKPISVRHLNTLDDFRNDHVLFIGANENSRLPQLIAAVDGATLIVSDAPDGLAAGAMINFLLVDRRLRFEISLPAAEAVGLGLSSRLLSAALRVETSRCGTECMHPPTRNRTSSPDETGPDEAVLAVHGALTDRTQARQYGLSSFHTAAPGLLLSHAPTQPDSR